MNSPYPITPGLKGLLIATGAVFVLQMLPWIGQTATKLGALVPFEVFCRGQVWRLASYMFLHSTTDLSHLLLNMLALWMFGGELEQLWGTRRFIGYYFLFGIGAGLFGALYLIDPSMRFVPVIGASGAIFGLLTAYAVYFPDREILLFFILPIRAWVLVAGYAGISLFFAFSHGAGVAHLVHFGGIAVAFGYLKLAPKVAAWRQGRSELRDERVMRARAEKAASQKRFLEERVDPILEKISRLGMESLTKEEKWILDEAGSSAKQRAIAKKIVPMDLFKRPR